MTISVVIPAYNEERYLPKTLASIGALARKPDEVVLIDGGSTDKTAEIAKKAGVRVVTIPHRGIGFARQQGLLAATSDVVAFTDADTTVPPLWLTKIEETLGRPGVVATYGHYIVEGGWWPYRVIINYIQFPWMRFMHAMRRPIAPGQNTAFWKNKALEVGGYPVDFLSAEDLEMARRLFAVGTVVYRPDNFVFSDSRRGNEGVKLFSRMGKILFRYFLFGKADTASFPDIR
jgi:glycosyltransferase involved in cell wall biosynthesis